MDSPLSPLVANNYASDNVHVEKRSSSSGGSGPVSMEGGNKDKGGGGGEQGEGGEVPSKKRSRVMGPALPPQLRRDMPEQVWCMEQ